MWSDSRGSGMTTTEKAYAKLRERYEQGAHPEWIRTRGDVLEWWKSVETNMPPLLPPNSPLLAQWAGSAFDSQAGTRAGILGAFLKHWDKWKPILNSAIETAELGYGAELPVDELPAKELQPTRGKGAVSMFGTEAVAVEGLRANYFVFSRDPFVGDSERCFLFSQDTNRDGPGYFYWVSRQELKEIKEALRPLQEFRCSDPNVWDSLSKIPRFKKLIESKEDFRKDLADAERKKRAYPFVFDLLKTCYVLAGLGEANYQLRKENGKWRAYFRIL